MRKTNLSNLANFQWNNQARQYPENGSGIMYFKGILPSGNHVDCLLYYGADGLLQGYLNYFPIEIPFLQEKGSINIVVRHDRRRKGIATALLNEAIKRFEINLENQEYTNDGERFIKQYKKTSIPLRALIGRSRLSVKN